MHPRRAVRHLALRLPGFEAACRRLSARHVKVLLYHRFPATYASSASTGIDAATLARQVELILRDHEVISVDEHIRRLASDEAPERSTVVVTVDDGYRDFFDVAFPVFERFGIPVTVFVATDFVDGGWLWWDRLRYSLFNTPARHLSVSVDGARFDVSLGAEDERAAAWNKIADRCRFLPNDAKFSILAEVERAGRLHVPESPPPEYSAFTWAEVGVMAAHGVSFASHTVSHPILTRIGREAVYREVAESRRVLTEKAGMRSRAFAYPQGGPADLDDEVIEAVRAAGIDGAYIAYQRGASPNVDRFRIPRNQPSNDLLDFRWELCGANYLWRRLRAAFGGSPDELFDGYGAGAT